MEELRSKHSSELEGLKAAQAAELRKAAAQNKKGLEEVRNEMARSIEALESAAKAAADRWGLG